MNPNNFERLRTTPDDSERMLGRPTGEPTSRSRFQNYRSRIGVNSRFLPTLPSNRSLCLVRHFDPYKLYLKESFYTFQHLISTLIIKNVLVACNPPPLSLKPQYKITSTVWRTRIGARSHLFAAVRSFRFFLLHSFRLRSKVTRRNSFHYSHMTWSCWSLPTAFGHPQSAGRYRD